MQRHLLLIAVVVIPFQLMSQTGIGTTSPHPSAKLDITSNSSGLLIPRMSNSQRNAISSPSNGLLIYQTNAPIGFYYFNGTNWLNISNLGTTNRYIPYSSQFAQNLTEQSLTAPSGTFTSLTGSDLEVIIPSGFTSSNVVLNWNSWGHAVTTNSGQGSLRYRIVQTGSSSNTYHNVAMTGWATIASSTIRFVTPVMYNITDLPAGTYTFRLEINREGEIGSIYEIKNYFISGSAQVFVK